MVRRWSRADDGTKSLGRDAVKLNPVHQHLYPTSDHLYIYCSITKERPHALDDVALEAGALDSHAQRTRLGRKTRGTGKDWARANSKERRRKTREIKAHSDQQLHSLRNDANSSCPDSRQACPFELRR